MAKPLGLEQLPYEVVEVIVTYLSATDLTHCLGVSRAWYNIFSDDIFWKRYSVTKDDYLSKTKCAVEPGFQPPAKPLLPIQKNKLRFLHEQHMWGNWDSGRFKQEEIVFDCDDSISYFIKVSFLDNDHLCLHRTSETEVWNVAETPFMVMAIPYCLNEMWEENIYEIIENNLVVIQSNVVQVYNICLDSKNWSLNHVFFFNKPEKFSSSITAKTDVNALFQLESDSDESNFERIICGQYVVGACTIEDSPMLHVWDIKTGKKIKEDTCELCKGRFSIELKAPRKAAKMVLVTFKLESTYLDGDDPLANLPFDPDPEDLEESACSVVYDLLQLQFLMLTVRYHSGTVMYFDGLLSVVDDMDTLKIIRYHHGSTKNKTKSESTFLPPALKRIHSVQPIGSSLLMSNKRELFLIDTTKGITQKPENISLLKVDFPLYHMCVLLDRYALLHDVDYEGIKEIWKLGKSLRKVMEFPDDSGTCVAKNKACSKIVLERANKLIVMKFW